MPRDDPESSVSPEAGSQTAPVLPAVEAPSGGGAIRGIGEAFEVNAVTGTASLSIPISLTPARGMFTPQLALAYDSGQGNGPFGLGWTLAVPSITRRTDRGLPRYGADDVFVLSGTEDLVPRIGVDGRPDTREETVAGVTFRVERYLPRVEGLYARIERWTDPTGAGHWRTLSAENVTSFYGLSPASQVTDPDADARIATWLLCASYDDKGNAVAYEYKAEDAARVDVAAAHEAQRRPQERTVQRYLKRVRYGNRRPAGPGDDLAARDDWCFEVVLDYGEHYEQDADGRPTRVSASDADRAWDLRDDPFSTRRHGFEVRTYRLCRRVLLFHCFPEELGEPATLVRALHLRHAESPIATVLSGVERAGYVRGADGDYRQQRLPALTLAYTEARPDRTVRELDLPVAAPDRRWLDIDGDGVAGLLGDDGHGWRYARNLTPVSDGATFAPPRAEPVVPSFSAHEQWSWLDVAADGQPDLVELDGGFYARARDGSWQPFTAFANVPGHQGDVRLVDLTGDGRPDVLATGHGMARWHAFLGPRGFAPGEPLAQLPVILDDPTRPVELADMTGDGLPDLVHLGSGEIAYWPNLGYGRFGAKVTMGGAPWLGTDDLLDRRRLMLVDVDGSGPADLIVLDGDEVVVHPNHAGNAWGAGDHVARLPATVDREAVAVVDLGGTGAACLVWSDERLEGRPARYVDLTGGSKPYLLTAIDNGMGSVTRLEYSSSTAAAIADDLAGRPWATRLPFPVQVVTRATVEDRVRDSRTVSRYAYHHGYFDAAEREFRGFGLVERWDTEAFDAAADAAPANLDAASFAPPVLTRTWYHTGAHVDGSLVEQAYERDFAIEPGGTRPALLVDHARLPTGLTAEEAREAARALRGVMLRQEIFGLDGSPAAKHPYTVSELAYEVACLQRRGTQRHAVMVVHARESVDVDYDRCPPGAGGEPVADPRIHHRVTLAVDAFGNLLRSADVVYGRRHPDPDLSSDDQAIQARPLVVSDENVYTDAVDTTAARRSPQLCETRTYEILATVPAGTSRLLTTDEVRTALDDARTRQVPYESRAVPDEPSCRLVQHTRTRFRRDDLGGPLAFGALESLAIPHETHALAFTAAMVSAAFGPRVTDAMLTEAGYVRLDDAAGWWTSSGRAFLSPDPAHTAAQELAFAREHFFLLHRRVDAFGGTATLRYDAHDLVPLESCDAVGNRSSAGERDADGTLTPRVDYRVLQPTVVSDHNRNRTSMSYDAIGRITSLAVAGKPEERWGDALDPAAERVDLAGLAADPVASAPALLGSATRRTVYDLHAVPAYSAVLAREQRGAAGPGRILITISYVDGEGATVQEKALAGPGRWATSGWTEIDNKGRPVRRFAPSFSATHRFEPGRREGTPTIACYDPIGRPVATVHPDHTYEKTRYPTWVQESWSRQDTVLVADPAADPDVGALIGRLRPDEYLPTWHAARIDGALGAAERDAAQKAAANANHPKRSYQDPMGRTFLVVESDGQRDVETRLILDIEGNTLGVIDGRGRAALRATFDLQGRGVQQRTLDAGESWQLPDASGAPARSWTDTGAALVTARDAARRLLSLTVIEAGQAPRVVERLEYGEAAGDAANQRGRVVRSHDAAGVLTYAAYDPIGNPLRRQLRLAAEYRQDPDWSTDVALDPQSFEESASYDALDRPVTVTTADGTIARLRYDDGGRLVQAEGNVRGDPAATVFLSGLEYDAYGDPVVVRHGNGAVTTYRYDALTRRLTGLATTRRDALVQDVAYVRDPLGDVTSRRDGAQPTVFFDNAIVSADASFTYDCLRRLTAATGREHVGQASGGAGPQDGHALRRYTQTFAYDAVGNLLELAHSAGDAGWRQRFGYDDATNRLLSTSLADTDVRRYTYDQRGNMTSMPHLAALAWDVRERLRRADLGGGGTAHYVYAASGSRARKVIERQNGTRQSETLYLGAVEIRRTYAGDGTTVTLERQTFRGSAGRGVVVESRVVGSDRGPDRQVRHQILDALGSVALELDGSGALITFEEYFPYGETSYSAVRSQSEVPKRDRFTGKERDEETGLADHGARLYAPGLARWISPDPSGMVDGPNRYVYTRDNPVNATDPDGRESKFGTEGKYPHSVTYKNFEAYAAGEGGSDAVVNADGTVTATVWTNQPPAAVAPQKPAPKAAPPKKRSVAKPKEQPKEVSAEELTRIAEALQPKLIYPKAVRQAAGALQLVGGTVEAVGGAVAAVVTAETVVGTVASIAVAAHGVDNATSGWTQMWTGEESKTWMFQAGAGYASMATDDVRMQQAVGQSVELMGNLASASHGLGSTPSAVVSEEAVVASEVTYGAKNTGKSFVGTINCPFCTAAGGNAFEMTSSEAAAFAGLSEAGNPGLSVNQISTMFRGMGLGDGSVQSFSTAAGAQAYMKTFPKGTKFGVGITWTGPSTIGGHIINGEVGTFGVKFIDNQTWHGLPSYSLPPQSGAVRVWVLYDPRW